MFKSSLSLRHDHGRQEDKGNEWDADELSSRYPLDLCSDQAAQTVAAIIRCQKP